MQEDTGITLERAVRETSRAVFHDARKFFDQTGGLNRLTRPDDDTASVLAALKLVQMTSEGMVVGLIKRIKLGGRKGYLDMLMKRPGGGLPLLQVGMAGRGQVKLTGSPVACEAFRDEASQFLHSSIEDVDRTLRIGCP